MSIGVVNPITQPQKVSAIMVISDPSRVNNARISLGQFMLQSYHNKELVIINASGYPVLDRPIEGVREIAYTPLDAAPISGAPATVARLRNAAISQCLGAWILFWDDDDFSHQNRITFLMAHRRSEHCVLLTSQARFNYKTRTICNFSVATGIAATILFPNQPDVRFNEELTRLEDVELVSRCFANRTVVVDNTSDLPGPVLQIAFWHGKNVLTDAEFMGPFNDPEHHGKWFGLSQSQLKYIEEAFAKYSPKPAADGSFVPQRLQRTVSHDPLQS